MTTEELWKRGSHRNSAVLCFPGKYIVAHIHNLITQKQVDLILSLTLQQSIYYLVIKLKQFQPVRL